MKSKTKISLPKNVHDVLEKNVLFYKKLSEENKTLFRAKAAKFLDGIYIDAVEFDLEELDIVLVAASAVIPVFYFDNFTYSNLTTVIIYPDYFNKNLCFKGENRNIAGMVGTGKLDNKMILSRRALHHGFGNITDKNNTAVHEFVHLLDKLDGKIDGIPEALLSKNYALPWLSMVHQKMEKINKDKSDIRNYGGTSKVEFFAVAAEYFFERPALLKRKHPELYEMLSVCFGIGKS